MSTSTAEELPEVLRWLDQLESAVLVAENALRRREWRELGEAISMQRRYTHGLRNALDMSVDLTQERRQQIDARIAAVLKRRSGQIRRLEHFHAQVGRRLRELTQFKFALRQIGGDAVPLALDTER